MNILYLGYLFGMFTIGMLCRCAWDNDSKGLSVLGLIGVVLIILYKMPK